MDKMEVTDYVVQFGCDMNVIMRNMVCIARGRPRCDKINHV
jgi:hypothetical protein